MTRPQPMHPERAIDVTEPEPGFFRMKLRGGGVLVGIRIWHGAPRDPVTGDEMDRSWRWQAECNGEPIDFERVWPQCAGDPITEAEYRAYSQRQRWAREKAPKSAYADPGRRLDLLSASNPLPF